MRWELLHFVHLSQTGWQPASRRNSSHWAPGILSVQVSLYQRKICKCWRCIKTYAGIQTRGDYFMPTAKFPNGIVYYWNNKHHTETPNEKGIHHCHKQELCGSFSISLERLSSLCLMKFEAFFPVPPYYLISAVIWCDDHFMIVLQHNSPHKI